ncbi:MULTISPECIES: AraC family transcriptional regulator [unclassified Oceanispirochaeta]|uniref:AraC family transcriptional regulator n=1 Tax=unclassified Oceanispirochaeta TaxID=2635722 RepID=UPI000E0988D3|nr:MULTISPECIES: helix-turn-helix domain-containing protein [unclassified Oceanispirochaeta]MBF9014629.1 AraC family transcriptional regulator [Oceanispirochaeta sp. M2]NPD70885.1 AraC family transcriptional regulator [Oceanispirochaeta sp. M1]RDG34164.1 AraC family transcriptional regulator [Oceanispirochaeta sp. M1]
MEHEDKYHPSDQVVFRSLQEEEYELTSDQLVNLRERHFPSDHKAHLHYHNTIEINVNRGVEGTVWIDGIAFNLNDIEVLVVPPGVMHAFEFKGGSGSFDVLHISLTRLGKYLNLHNIFGDDLQGLKSMSSMDEGYKNIKSMIGKMKEVEDEDVFTQLQIILEIFNRIFKESNPIRSESKNASLLKMVIDYTETNYNKKIDLNEISSYTGLSRSYFSRFFKKTTGTGYFTYLTLMRLEKAKVKIRRGESVTESCYSSGFDNISYFIQLFKKHNKGISPGKFREQ